MERKTQNRAKICQSQFSFEKEENELRGSEKNVTWILKSQKQELVEKNTL